MKKFTSWAWFFTVVVIFFTMGIASVAPKQYVQNRPEPCIRHAAITGSPLLIKVNVDGNYTMKDLASVRETTPDLFLQNLRDHNSSSNFKFADGVTPNLIFYIMFTNDGYNHYGAEVTVNGLGEGYLFRFTLDQNYITITKLVDDMARRANEFITRGWSRGDCKDK